MHNGIRSTALMLTVGLACAACTADAPMTSAELWSSVGASTAFSDEPETLDEVVATATLIVKARIARVYAGPDTVHHPPEGEVRQPSLLLDLEPTEVLEGTAPEQITVHLTMIAGDVRATDDPPADEHLWLLEPSGVENYFMTSSFSGVIAELNGELTTPRDPASSVLEPGWDDLDDATEAIVELTN